MLSATDHLYWVDSSTSRQAAIGHLLPGATDRYGSIRALQPTPVALGEFESVDALESERGGSVARPLLCMRMLPSHSV